MPRLPVNSSALVRTPAADHSESAVNSTSRVYVFRSFILIACLGVVTVQAEPSLDDGACRPANAALKSDAEEIRRLLRVLAHPAASSDKLPEAQEAIKRLVAIGAPAVPQITEAVIKSDGTASAYSLLTLVEIGKPAVACVRTAWNGLSETERWKLMPFCGTHDYEAVVAFAISSLQSKSADVRSLAIEYLGRHKEARARDLLLGKLNSETPELRWDVVEALTNLGGEKVIDAYIALLSPDSWAASGEGLPQPDGDPPSWWPDGRWHIIEALGKLDAKRSAPVLLKVLQEKGVGKAYLGSRILPLLGEFGYTASIKELHHILATDRKNLARCDYAAEIHAHAAKMLWQFGDRRGRAVILQFVLEQERGTGEIVRNALTECADKGDLWVLAWCLDDPWWQQRRFACRTLEQLMGHAQRAPGWAETTEHDAPLWQEWYREHKHKFCDLKLRRTGRVHLQPSQTHMETANPGTAHDPQSLWSELGSRDTVEGFRSMLTLGLHPKVALRLANDHLRPVVQADPRRVTELIKALDASEYDEREHATQELERVAETAVDSLRTSLKTTSSEESRRRLSRLLSRADAPLDLRIVRLLAVIELIGSEDSTVILEKLAHGAAGAKLTIEANAALERRKSLMP